MCLATGYLLLSSDVAPLPGGHAHAWQVRGAHKPNHTDALAKSLGAPGR